MSDPPDSENLGKFIFNNDPGTRKMGLAMAKGVNSTESQIMIKALARWDPVLGGDAELLIEKLGIDSEWTEDDEDWGIMEYILENKPTDIMWYILDNQGILCDNNSEDTPESCEPQYLGEIIGILANDVAHKDRLLDLLDNGPYHYDIIFGVIRTAVEKKWEDIIPSLIGMYNEQKHEENDFYIKSEIEEALDSFSKNAILRALGVGEDGANIAIHF